MEWKQNSGWEDGDRERRRKMVAAEPRAKQEWLRQLSLIYSGLIGIGVVMVQPFLTAASPDLSAMVCVVAFSLAIPLLAALAQSIGRKLSVGV